MPRSPEMLPCSGTHRLDVSTGSLDGLTAESSLGPEQIVGLRRPFILVPGNIGLPIIEETPPAGLLLSAPTWWREFIYQQPEPWRATVFWRGAIQELSRVRVLPTHISPDSESCSLTVVAEDGSSLAAHFHNRALREDLDQSFFDAARIEVITDEVLIHRAFNAALHLGAKLRVTGQDGESILAKIWQDETDGDAILISLPQTRGAETAWAELHGQCAVFRFSLVACAKRSETLLELPRHVIKIRRRRQVRVQAPSGLALEVRVADRLVGAQIVDVSATGLSFRSDSDLIAPIAGLTLPDARVFWDGHRVWHGVLQVVNERPEGVGACLSVPSPDTANDWYRLMDRLIHPRNLTGSACASQSWENFRKSGYFYLSGKDPSDFEPRRPEFEEANRRLDLARPLGTLIHSNQHNGVEASVSVAKYHSRSLLVHQLGKHCPKRDIVHSLKALQDIYSHAYEFCTRDPRNRWTVIYTEGHVEWHTRSHHAFAAARHESVSVQPIRLLQLSALASPRPTRNPDHRAMDASHGDRELLAATLAERRPFAYCDALDLTSELIHENLVEAAFAQAGIARERRIWSVRRKSRPVAWLIADSCTPTLNLFSLFDSIRLVSIDQRGTLAFPTLIDRARQWFLRRGKTAFVCFAEEGQWAVQGLRQALDLGEGHMWICATKGVLDFVEHVVEVTSPLVRERLRIAAIPRAG